jgi:hypothetical protein
LLRYRPSGELLGDAAASVDRNQAIDMHASSQRCGRTETQTSAWSTRVIDMIFHTSFNAHAPEFAARTLAGLLGATAIRAPAPPFPEASWFVCVGNSDGSLIEILPWGATREPATKSTIGHDAAMRPCGHRRVHTF